MLLLIVFNLKKALKNNIMVALVEKGDGSPAAALVADVEDQASVDSYSQVS